METKSDGMISLIKKPLVYKLFTGVCVTMVTIPAIFISPFLSKNCNNNIYTGFSLPGQSTVMEFKTQILEVGQILEIQTQLLRCACL